MITNWQELGEVLAEWEIRLSYLENLHTPSDASLNQLTLGEVAEKVIKITDPRPRQDDLQKQIDYLKSLLVRYQNQLNGHIDISKKVGMKKKAKYTQYKVDNPPK